MLAFLAVIASFLQLGQTLEVRAPTKEALAQVQAEADLLQGFRNEDGQPIASDSGSLGLGSNPSASCDVSATGPVCFANRQRSLLPPAVTPGLVGHWSFDGSSAVDSSGNGNHGVTELLHGPSPAGSGHSALFRKNFLTIPNSAQFQLQDFSYSFWVYLLGDDTTAPASDSPRWCPLVRKGIHETATRQFASAPAVLHSRSTGRVRVSLTTSVAGTEDGEFVESNARVLPNRWMHITVVHKNAMKRLSLYVNGILDATATLHGMVVPNDFPLYVGGDPFTIDDCEHPMYIDELRIYSRAIMAHELEAEAAPALAGMGPSFTRLGCLSCPLRSAVESCPSGHHLCTSLELHTGGYQVARSLGWLGQGTHVWTHAAVVNAGAAEQNGAPSQQSQQMGLGICCSGRM